ncbi:MULTISPECIES: LysR family transcriptional regulator [Kordiimonas]|jgi:DNA-binding transcriptional LysR family regulator|uniref:LysR family transcriptional regulator n=1 Tax=Kordiimonas TaxID=288021 RepID=UPI00257E5D97|nr:LysR family transcriptional regulator [Kordiimonas sp. UBA4487]
MDLEQLKTFVAVVRAGGVSAAARTLGLPRTTVSARVAALETQMDTILLRRTTRSITPTDAGARLYDQVRRSVETLEAVGDSFEAPGGPLRGLVRCAVPQDFPRDALVRTLASLRAVHPQIRVDFRFSNAVARLADEDIDVAIRFGAPEAPSLIVRRLGGTRYALVASPTYMHEKGVPEQASDLADHRLLVFTATAGAPKRSPLMAWASLAPDAVMAANDMAFLRTLAVAGYGIACLPAPLCADELGTGRLVELEIDGWSGEAGRESAFCLVFPSRREITARVRAFADHLTRALEDA